MGCARAVFELPSPTSPHTIHTLGHRRAASLVRMIALVRHRLGIAGRSRSRHSQGRRRRRASHSPCPDAVNIIVGPHRRPPRQRGNGGGQSVEAGSTSGRGHDDPIVCIRRGDGRFWARRSLAVIVWAAVHGARPAGLHESSPEPNWPSHARNLSPDLTYRHRDCCEWRMSRCFQSIPYRSARARCSVLPSPYKKSSHPCAPCDPRLALPWRTTAAA
jgi:hypothetical protein